MDVTPMDKQSGEGMTGSAWRGVALGLFYAAVVAALTPWNDFVLGNTSLIGGFVPLGLTLLVFATVLANAVSIQFRTRPLFTTAQLSIALAMGLVACTVPASGLMRYLPAGIVGIQNVSATDPQRIALLDQLHLPRTLFPGSAGSEVIDQYYGRTPGDGTVPGRVPWRAWMMPAVAWGVLIAALYGAVLAAIRIVHRQWAVNERLAFPLASVYGALIDPPGKGRALNAIMGSRAFWIAGGVVFVIHLLNGLHQLNASIPAIPLRFDLSTMLANEPWDRIDTFLKRGTVFFSVIGLCYFVRLDIAFSVWACFVLLQVYRLIDPSMPLEMNHPAAIDQSFGALVVYALSAIWIGRSHFAMVLRQMVRPRREPDEPYRAAAWSLAICCIALVAWLVWAGASVIGAIVIVIMGLTVLLAVARVVAETGLFFVQINAPVQQPLLVTADLSSMKASTGSFFFASLFTGFFTHDARESFGAFASQGLSITQERAPKRWPLLIVLAITLVVAFAVSGASTLMAEYSYSINLQDPPASPINAYGTDNVPVNQILNPTSRFDSGTTHVAHSRWMQIGTGGSIMTALSVLRYAVAWWPIHPVGYLLVYTRPVTIVWFSLFLGWLGKSLLIRFGGSSLYRSAMPACVGLIVGEIIAAAFWVVFTAISAIVTGACTPAPILP